MSKIRIIKAQGGLQFSSSPLTSLNPAYSANQNPNFSNAFQFGRNRQGFQLGADIQQRWDQLGRDFENQKFSMGLSLSTSKDPTARQYGQQLVQDRMNQLSQPLFQDDSNQPNPNDLYADDVARLNGSNWQAGLDAAGKVLGGLPGQTGKVAQQALGAVGGIKNYWSNLKEISALQKAGVEGLGKAKTGNAFAIAGAAADLVGGFMPEKTEYAGDKGGITQTIDTVYDGISDAAMSFGPVGMIVGGAMKGANLLGKGFNALGGGTDGMTTQDAILGSSLFSWNVGLINGFGGQKADTITKDEDVQAKIGSGYTGSFNKIDDALLKSGKKYGLFSGGARKDANEEIAEAKRQQNIMTNISDQATDRFSIVGAMSTINGNRRRYQLQGGYDQAAVRIGRQGMIIQDLQRAKRIVGAAKYQKGGKVTDPFQSYLQTLPKNQQDSTQFRVKDYWEFNGKPKNFDEAVFRGMFTQFDDGWHANSVAENPKTGEIEFMKSSTHPSIQKELDWYESDDASEFRSQYELQKTEPYFKYVKRKGTDQPQSFKEGGNLTKSDWLVEVDINNLSIEFRGADLEEVDVDNILPEFKEGGKFNLIPEGALHARKHNMDVEGITPKGIPVVSHSEGGEIEQQAEIEREEIIFRLEVTKKLEELAKDGSDEAAIEAGKLLVEEILYNTIDNTNSLI